jgi:hypothetical protein
MSGDAQLGSAETVDRLLSALSDQLSVLGASYELVVIGGSAMLALGLTARATQDVDVVALVGDGELRSAKPLEGPLREAGARVARDFDLPTDWLNSEPGDLLRFGLPVGFVERLERRVYSPFLTVSFASRLDQIHFKLYAAADGIRPKHGVDLRSLNPTPDELVVAARWTLEHDISEGYRGQLIETLARLGVTDADLGS